jgi:hypothetical protein
MVGFLSIRQRSGAPFVSDLVRGSDVGVLAGLVTAGEQQDDTVAVLEAVDAVAGAVADPQFGDAAADVSRVAGRQSVDPDQYPRTGAGIFQFSQPSVEGVGSDDRDYMLTIVDIYGYDNTRPSSKPTWTTEVG